MNCKNCNSPLPEGTKFCPNCGQQVVVETTPVIEPVVVPEQPVTPQPVVTEQPAEVLEVEGEVSNAANVVNETIPEPTPIQPMPVYTPPKKSKAPLIIGLVVGGVVLILGIIGFIFWMFMPVFREAAKNGNSNTINTNTNTNTNTPVGYKDYGWTYADVDMDSYKIDVMYNKGIEDDFKVYGTYTYKDLVDTLYENAVFNTPYGEELHLNKKMLNKVASFYFINKDEYKNFELLDNKQTFEVTWSILATLAYEFDNDGFMPEKVIYNANTNDYYFYGQLQGPDENGLQNVGNAVINFGNGQMFSGVMCGDYIYWKFNPSNPTVFYLGTDIDDLTSFNVDGFNNIAGFMNEALVNLYE